MKKIILPYSLKDGFISDARNVSAIEITENGSYDVKAYEVANVNVEGGGGSSDFSTATLTTVGDVGILIKLPTLLIVPEYNLEGSYPSNQNLTSPFTVILYKGKAYLPLENVRETSGDIELDSNTGLYVMTGNCTVEFEIA